MGGLIPLGDASRRTARKPLVTGLLIVVNVYVFLQELLYGDTFVAQWSEIPAQITSGIIVSNGCRGSRLNFMLPQNMTWDGGCATGDPSRNR